MLAFLFCALSRAEVLEEASNTTTIDPISKGNEIGITCGIEFGLVLISVICYFAFRRSLVRGPEDPKRFHDEDKHDEGQTTEEPSVHEDVTIEHIDEI